MTDPTDSDRIDPIDRAEVAIWHAFHDAPWFLAVSVRSALSSAERVLCVYVRGTVPPHIVWPLDIVPVLVFDKSVQEKKPPCPR